MNTRTSICIFLLSFLSLSAKAELSIQITQGIDNPIPIAVVPFVLEGAGVLSEDVARIVINDLEQVGEFLDYALGGSHR